MQAIFGSSHFGSRLHSVRCGPRAASNVPIDRPKPRQTFHSIASYICSAKYSVLVPSSGVQQDTTGKLYIPKKLQKEKQSQAVILVLHQQIPSCIPSDCNHAMSGTIISHAMSSTGMSFQQKVSEHCNGFNRQSSTIHHNSVLK